MAKGNNGEKPKAKRERKALEPLKDAAAEQMKAIEASGSQLLATVNQNTAIPVPHLRRYFSDLGRVFRAKMKERHGDPVARKKANLQAKLAKIQEQLGLLDKETA